MRRRDCIHCVVCCRSRCRIERNCSATEEKKNYIARGMNVNIDFENIIYFFLVLASSSFMELKVVTVVVVSVVTVTSSSSSASSSSRLPFFKFVVIDIYVWKIKCYELIWMGFKISSFPFWQQSSLRHPSSHQSASHTHCRSLISILKFPISIRSCYVHFSDEFRLSFLFSFVK